MDLGRHKVINADCLEYMRRLPDNCIDAVICDPPYGLGFMGKQWDQSVPGLEWAAELLRVSKPGAHAICFGGTRTYHRLAVALEDAGWEIRDCLGWVYTSGFPKSHDVSKAIDKAAGVEPSRITENKSGSLGGFGDAGWNETPRQLHYDSPTTADAKKWSGWGTSVKPSFEPAVLARKPLEGTIAQNVQKWGTGALNIDAARFGYGDPCWVGPQEMGDSNRFGKTNGGEFVASFGLPPVVGHDLGRWPANLYHCPKASRSEREAGCEGIATKTREDVTGRKPDSAGANHARSGMTRRGAIGNSHPTVKPLTLFRWLVKLCTPPGGWILDPFLGSGTTLLAAELEGFRCVGVEMNPEYCEIVRARFGGLPVLRKMANGVTLTAGDKSDLILQGDLFK